MWSCLQNQGLEVFCKSLLLIFSWPELNHLTSSQQQKRILRKRKRCGPYRPLLLPQWSLFWIATLMKMNSWGTCWSVFYRCGKNQAKSEAITEENNTKTERELLFIILLWSVDPAMTEPRENVHFLCVLQFSLIWMYAFYSQDSSLTQSHMLIDSNFIN